MHFSKDYPLNTHGTIQLEGWKLNINLSIYLFNYLSIHLSICRTIYWSIYLSMFYKAPFKEGQSRVFFYKYVVKRVFFTKYGYMRQKL